MTRCFVIAEAGVNHDGDLNLALDLVAAGAEAGADAVKFQTFRAVDLASPDAPLAAYQARGGRETESQLEMLTRLELPDSAWPVIRQKCEAEGVLFLSSPFDLVSLRLLTQLGVSALKLGSGEVTNEPLLRAAGRARLPVILSTGMANLQEVRNAVDVLREYGTSDLTLLHCVSSYPAPPEYSNLRAMTTLRAEFCTPVGFSDHTTGFTVAIAAIGMGASVIEKHITLDRKRGGPDHAASLEPSQFGQFVNAIREAESALGDGEKRPVGSEIEMRRVARRSLFAGRHMEARHVLGEEDLVARRPADGLTADHFGRVIGRRLRTAIMPGEPLLEENLE